MKFKRPETLFGWMIWLSIPTFVFFVILVVAPIMKVVEHFVMKYW